MSESKMNFDEALQQLEQVVRQLEAGNLPLERSIELYKQGENDEKECLYKQTCDSHNCYHITDTFYDNISKS